RWRRTVAEARATVAHELPRLAQFARELERRFLDARLGAFSRPTAAGLLAIELRALYADEAAGIAGQLALGLLAERIASSQAWPQRWSGSRWAPSAHSFQALTSTSSPGRSSRRDR